MTPLASVNLPEIQPDSDADNGTEVSLPSLGSFGVLRRPIDFTDGPGDPDSGKHLVGNLYNTGLVLVGLATADGAPQAIISNPTGAVVSGCVLDLY